MKNLILILSIFIFGSCTTKEKQLERPFVIIDKQSILDLVTHPNLEIK